MRTVEILDHTRDPSQITARFTLQPDGSVEVWPPDRKDEEAYDGIRNYHVGDGEAFLDALPWKYANSSYTGVRDSNYPEGWDDGKNLPPRRPLSNIGSSFAKAVKDEE